MTALLKQRLVGAIVLISLGIIFIPMLLTGTDSLTTEELPTNIPPKPLYEIQAPAVLPIEPKSHAEPVMEPVPESSARATEKPTSANSVIASGSAASGAVVNDSSANEKSAKTSAVALAGTQVKPGSEQQDEPSVISDKVSDAKQTSKTQQAAQQSTPVSPEASPTRPKPESTDKATPETTTQLSTAKLEKDKPKQTVVKGWVVQLGSFSVEKNALKLRDKLRKNGHASFVEEYDRQGKTSYRVRVGPELTRELADKLKTQLKKETKIDGLVMAFPSK